MEESARFTGMMMRPNFQNFCVSEEENIVKIQIMEGHWCDKKIQEDAIKSTTLSPYLSMFQSGCG